jgi:hypothetical protein
MSTTRNVLWCGTKADEFRSITVEARTSSCVFADLWTGMSLVRSIYCSKRNASVEYTLTKRSQSTLEFQQELGGSFKDEPTHTHPLKQRLLFILTREPSDHSNNGNTCAQRMKTGKIMWDHSSQWEGRYSCEQHAQLNIFFLKVSRMPHASTSKAVVSAKSNATVQVEQQRLLLKNVCVCYILRIQLEDLENPF